MWEHQDFKITFAFFSNYGGRPQATLGFMMKAFRILCIVCDKRKRNVKYQTKKCKHSEEKSVNHRQLLPLSYFFLSVCVCEREYVNVCFGGSRRPRRGIFVFFRVGFFFAFVRLLRFAFHHCAKGEI